MKDINLTDFLLWLSLITMAFSGLMLNNNVSMFMVAAGLLIINHLISRRSILLPSNGIIIFVLSVLISFGLNFQSSGLITIVYLLFFIYFFVVFNAQFSPKVFLTGLKFIFFMYLIWLILGQIYVSLGLFIPNNIGETGLQHGPFGTIYQLDGDVFRQGSLSTEPSYAGFLTATTMVAILELNRYYNKTTPLIYWVVYLYMMISYVSSFSFLMLPVPFLLFLKRSHFNFKNIAVLVLGGIIVVYLVSGLPFFERLINFFSFFTGNIEIQSLSELATQDGSSFVRVAPFFIYLYQLQPFESSFWLGNGIDYGSELMTGFLAPTAGPDYLFPLHFFPGFLYDFGVLLAVVFIWVFIVSTKLFKNIAFLWVMIPLVFNANINTQLFWYCILCFGVINSLPAKEAVAESKFQITI
ncbi:MAG: hypothetical protein JXQ92_11425 [Roseivirga sp.]